MNSSFESKWQLAFWLVTSFYLALAIFIGNAVITNDRLRASEDQRIEFGVGLKIDSMNDKFTMMATDIKEIKTILKVFKIDSTVDLNNYYYGKKQA